MDRTDAMSTSGLDGGVPEAFQRRRRAGRTEDGGSALDAAPDRTQPLPGPVVSPLGLNKSLRSLGKPVDLLPCLPGVMRTGLPLITLPIQHRVQFRT